jgi:hypothetical protein
MKPYSDPKVEQARNEIRRLYNEVQGGLHAQRHEAHNKARIAHAQRVNSGRMTLKESCAIRDRAFSKSDNKLNRQIRELQPLIKAAESELEKALSEARK